MTDNQIYFAVHLDTLLDYYCLYTKGISEYLFHNLLQLRCQFVMNRGPSHFAYSHFTH